MSTITQEQFVTNYLQLLSVKSGEIVYNDDFKAESETLTDSPVTIDGLPPKKTLFKKSETTKNASSKSFTLKLKSIKPPYKFNDELVLPGDFTIFQVKEFLVKHLKNGEPDKYSGLDVSNLKFLIKSKVPQDSVQLTVLDGAVENVINVTVMISKFVNKPISTQVGETPSTDSNTEKLEINVDSWSSIKKVLVNQLGEANADVAFKRLKKGWDLSV